MLSNGKRFGKNVIIFGADFSQSMHIDNKKKDILILGKSPADGLDDTSLTAEKEYSINFAITQKKFCLSLHSNSRNSYIIVSSVEIYKFKVKYSEINTAPLCLGKMKKLDCTDMSLIFHFMMILLMLMIIWIFINIL